MIMGPITSANTIMQIIFAQLIFVTVINAESWSYSNATNYDSLGKSERLKRAPFHRYIPPDTLRATIKDGNKEIHLTWQRSNRYLFNKHLPVYTTHMNSWGPNHKQSNVMEIIGNTITYHDIAHKSAVMYVENGDRLYGVVGRSYEIVNLPMDRLSQPLEVGGPYVNELLYGPHGKKKWKRPSEPRCHNPNAKRRRLNSGEVSTSSIQSRGNTVSERFYVETLLFVTYDVFQFFSQRCGNAVMHALVLMYLLHFNAVDMVFTNLPTNNFEIYINLAGIIIEAEDGVISKIVNYPPLKFNNENELRTDGYIFYQFDRYSEHFDFPFPRDSFDYILISTGRELLYRQNDFKAWHMNVHDIFFARQHNNEHSFVPMAIVRSVDTYLSYCVVAHKIGKILGIEINDPENRDITKDGIQCYGIMQTSMHHCSACIKWSEESIRQLESFLSGNRNRCFLLNEPRSLHPPGTPIISLSPCRQCTCFGYTSYGMESLNECPLYIPSEGCSEPLLCRISHKKCEGQSQLKPTILPFDGTPCGANKVCWGDKCRSLT